ncbi:MAG: O-antigen ligase family protein [Chloroflexaceae bacterium]|nr:O-antigen ligase family protein [Chloroflexaceae bacterium]
MQHTDLRPRALRNEPVADTLRHLLTTPAGAALCAVLVGAIVGGGAAFGPIYVAGGLLALAAGLFIMTSTMAGLVVVFAIMLLLPFGTLPFDIGITPTLLSLALVGVLGVWVLRLLARSDTYDLRLTPLGLPILGFLGFTFFSLFLGARGLPDTTTLHNYAKFILGVLLFFSIVNCIRSRKQARFLLRAVILLGSATAAVGLFLLILPDELALRLLVALGRIGYPTEGRVLRYVEDDVDGLERAIGTAVDPNSFGGMLALVLALAAAQLFARRPVLPYPVLVGCVGLMGLALLLTFSRAALFGVIFAAIYLATLRYRRLWWAMIAAGVCGVVVLSSIGIFDDFVQRVTEGVQFQDQAQQMRLAEYQNAIAIIQRYPVFGIGFGAAPEIDLVAGVSSIYLAIGQRMGLVGLAAFLAIVAAWFVQTVQVLPQLDEERAAWVLGTQAGLVAALAVGLADHYFFNIEFSHMGAMFWGCMSLGLAVVGVEEGEPPGGAGPM